MKRAILLGSYVPYEVITHGVSHNIPNFLYVYCALKYSSS